MKTSNFCMKVERLNFILVPNSALSTNVFLQSKCNMHGWYDHASWSWCSCIALLEQSSESSLIMPDFDLTGELSPKIELHMLRPITEKVHSGNGPVLLVHDQPRRYSKCLVFTFFDQTQLIHLS